MTSQNAKGDEKMDKMDIVKEKIEELVAKIQEDESLGKLFKEDPIKAVEKILDTDLPDDLVKKIVAGVKAKLGIEDVKDIFGTLKKLF